jgi:uncharacterized protein (UPF0261 family)
MKKTVALLGAFDTKGAEYRFVEDCIRRRGLETFRIDVGVLGAPALVPHVSSAEVASAAGADVEALRTARDRGAAMAAMSQGVEKLVPRLFAEGKFDGILALGGTGGTSVACRAMRALPLGVPKVVVSTVAGRDVSAYVGIADILMIPSVVDIAGLNRLSVGVLARAAAAVSAMVETEPPPHESKPLVVASMFGNTTQAVEAARAVLEAAGCEVLVFHATGQGGRTMESLIDAGLVSGVLDVTTTEWADELVGGVMAAGPSRLEAAARMGVPAVVFPGCLDMVNFNAPETVPAAFAGRRFYQHNPNVTLMRTNVEENRRLGAILAEKLNGSRGPVTVFLPLRGLSVIGAPGGAFHFPEADQALFAALRAGLRSDIPVVEADTNINDPDLARRAAETLLGHLGTARNPKG